MYNELILFATSFAKRYRLLSKSTYFSQDKTYRLHFDTNSVFGASQNNVWRVEHLSHAMQVSIDLIQDPEISQDFVFFMIIWSGCLIHYKQELHLTDFERADKETMAYYQTTGRSLKNIEKGYVFIFKKWASSEANNKRLKWVFDVCEDPEIKKLKILSNYSVNQENKTVTLSPVNLRHRSYDKFLEGTLVPGEIQLSDFLHQTASRMREIYIPKEFSILFEYKKQFYEIVS